MTTSIYTHQLSIKQVAAIVNGQLTGKTAQINIQHLLLDSRKVRFTEATLFFAIKGVHYNGHDFIRELYQRGVHQFIISQTIDYQAFPEACFILVNNTTLALQQLAQHHRAQFTLPIIGITGSNGKTVVKEWLYQLLWQDYRIVRSPKSYNSQVGVPLSIWQINEHHQLGIFEAGISQVGEMQQLAPIIEPIIGIFTNIGSAHSQHFTNKKEKIFQKLKLFKQCELLIYSKDHTLIDQCVQSLSLPALTWSKKGLTSADLQIIAIEKQAQQSHLTAIYQEEKTHISIPFIDEASIENAIHCWLVLLHFQIPQAQISKRMKQLSAIEMRLKLKAGINDCSLISDCYNSDLNSLAIALDFLEQQQQHAKKTLILSDILQSSQKPQQLYETVLQLIQQKNVTRFIGIGTQIAAFKSLFNKHLAASFYPDTETFLQQIPHFERETILIKGARPFTFEKIVAFLAQKAHNTILEINLNAIAHNLQSYRKLLHPATKMMVMVKALSYGSGSFEIANLLQFNKVDYLAVAYTDEGIALRQAGITLPIMVMNPQPSTFEALLQHQLEPEIYSPSHLQKLQYHLKNRPTPLSNPVSIHLKIDTGMHRLGFESEDLPTLIQHLKNNPYFHLASILSHLAASDDSQHDDFSYRQIRQFKEMATAIQSAFDYPILTHILNSTGIVRFAESAQLEMVRLGLGLYGVDSTNIIQNQLANVSSLKTYISQIKSVAASETVGYSRKGKLHRASRVATVGIGYGDGLNRRLSGGKGKMLVHGQLAPILGNVCMDMTMLDVTHIPEAKEGDEVLVFGKDLPVQQVAAWMNTIPYEVFTSVSSRVKRVYFQE